MSENSSNVEVTKEDDTPISDPVAVSISKDVKQHLEDRQSDGIIREKVVSHFADKEQDRRVNLLVSAMDKRTEKEKELQKVQADKKFFDDTGAPAGAYWSKEQLKKRNELKKALNKMDKAINRAVNDADYEGLKKFASSGSYPSSAVQQDQTCKKSD